MALLLGSDLVDSNGQVPRSGEKRPSGERLSPSFHKLIAQSADLYSPEADVQHVITAAKAIGARLVVVDTLARVMPGGNEDRAQDMGAVIRNFDRIREEASAHVAVVHHGLKNGGDLPRGSGALIGAADLVVAVSRGEDGAGKAEVTHMKDDAEGDVFGFRLRGVELPPDRAGRLRATCVAEEADAGPRRRAEKPLTETQRGWLRDIEDAFATPGLAAERVPGPGMAPRVTLTRDQVRDGLRARGRIGDAAGDAKLTGADRNALYKMLNLLKDKGKLGLTADLVWLL